MEIEESFGELYRLREGLRHYMNGLRNSIGKYSSWSSTGTSEGTEAVTCGD
jgi:hypothetical protein